MCNLKADMQPGYLHLQRETESVKWYSKPQYEKDL